MRSVFQCMNKLVYNPLAPDQAMSMCVWGGLLINKSLKYSVGIDVKIWTTNSDRKKLTKILWRNLLPNDPGVGKKMVFIVIILPVESNKQNQTLQKLRETLQVHLSRSYLTERRQCCIYYTRHNVIYTRWVSSKCYWFVYYIIYTAGLIKVLLIFIEISICMFDRRCTLRSLAICSFLFSPKVEKNFIL